MAYVECSTQAQLDKVKPGDIAVVRKGFFTAYDSSTVTACGSSTVTAYGSSTVRAYDSSTVRAYDSSTVTACGSSTVTAYDSSTVRAGKFTAVHHLSERATITGGVVIRPTKATPQDWCAAYGITPKRGFVTLFKAVEDDWRGQHKSDAITYRPGDKPVAPDFTTVEACGGGLHLSPFPFMARRYCDTATRFVACKVRLTDLVLLDDKVKVRTCTVLHEVDEDGNEVTA
jgi:hypothetical protein